CAKVSDQLLVAFGWNGSEGSYWSGDPTVAAGASPPHMYSRGGSREIIGLPIPGGHTLGGDPWYPGDPPQGGVHPVATDGVTFWRCLSGFRDRTLRWQWHEFDPVSKAAGRESMPGFFSAPPATPLPADANLLPMLCELRPAPAEFAGSPLGWRDGLVGFRVWRLPDGSQIGEGIDGRRVTVPPNAGPLLGAVTLPGDDRTRPVTSAN